MIIEKLLQNLNTISSLPSSSSLSSFSALSSLSSLSLPVAEENESLHKHRYIPQAVLQQCHPSHRIRLLNVKHQLSSITARNYSTRPRPSYTGIGSLNKKHAEEKNQFALKLATMFINRKEKAESDKQNKLNKLLEDEALSTDDKQRLKIAFAEGYSASGTKQKTGRRPNIRDLIWIAIGIAIISAVQVTMSANGRLFRVFDTNEVTQEDIDVTFDDVMGVHEAKQELQEIVEFLKNPEKFSHLGGKLPKGVLLVGPPGTGKTLLARAVAGEAGVPFFHVAGPEFDEVLVGQGAKRVRGLFATAKAKAPCVIFIDEIDSVGSKRTNSGLHPYANQTINQLLSEMDGFKQNEGVIVLGATNRRNDLDKALLRPGRFDVEVNVPKPDAPGRKDILQLYLDKIKVSFCFLFTCIFTTNWAFQPFLL